MGSRLPRRELGEDGPIAEVGGDVVDELLREPVVLLFLLCVNHDHINARIDLGDEIGRLDLRVVEIDWLLSKGNEN